MEIFDQCMVSFQGGHETSATALLWWSRLLAEPEAFGPERFLPDAEPPPRGAWMPFGAGPRVCIGQHFAMLEMTLVAAMLLQRYRLVLPVDAPICVPELHVTFARIAVVASTCDSPGHYRRGGRRITPLGKDGS